MKVRQMSKSILVIILLISLLLLGGCASKPQESSTNEQPAQETETTSESQKPVEKTAIAFSTGGTGGEYYPISAAISEQWKKDIAGLEVSLQPLGGATAGAKAVATRQTDVGLTQGMGVAMAVNGIPPFTDKLPDNTLNLASLYTVYLQTIVYKDSSIQKMEDLKGKTVNIYPPNFISSPIDKIIIEAYGIKMDEVKTMNLDDAEAGDAFKDGQVDVIMQNAALPESTFVDVSTMRPIRILPLSEEVIIKVNSSYPALQRTIIPKGVYNGVDEDVVTVCDRTILGVNKDVPEELVYQMTKSLAENFEILPTVHAAFKGMEAKDLAQYAGIPFHPGAERYYKEQGWIK